MPDTIAADNIEAEMRRIAEAARAAMHELGVADEAAKNAALHEAATSIRDSSATLLEANARDLDEVGGSDVTESFLDRLKLDDDRIEGMAKALEDIAALPDPVGREIGSREGRVVRLRLDGGAGPVVGQDGAACLACQVAHGREQGGEIHRAGPRTAVRAARKWVPERAAG